MAGRGIRKYVSSPDLVPPTVGDFSLPGLFRKWVFTHLVGSPQLQHHLISPERRIGRISLATEQRGMESWKGSIKMKITFANLWKDFSGKLRGHSLLRRKGRVRKGCAFSQQGCRFCIGSGQWIGLRPFLPLRVQGQELTETWDSIAQWLQAWSVEPDCLSTNPVPKTC